MASAAARSVNLPAPGLPPTPASRTLSLAVVGVGYPNKGGGNRQFEVMMCDLGERVELHLESTNPVDPNAVAVYSSRGIQMGYIRAERAQFIAGIIRAGNDVRAIFQSTMPSGGIIRVNLDGDDPVLPPAQPGPFTGFRFHQDNDHHAEGAQPDPGFFPDYVPPDD